MRSGKTSVFPGRSHSSEINDEVVRLAWSIASWTWDGHGPIDHSPEAQSRRGVASAKVRRYLAYERDRFIVARLDAGESTRAVAREFGVSRWTVRTARARLSRAPASAQRCMCGGGWALYLVLVFWGIEGGGLGFYMSLV